MSFLHTVEGGVIFLDRIHRGGKSVNKGAVGGTSGINNVETERIHVEKACAEHLGSYEYCKNESTGACNVLFLVGHSLEDAEVNCHDSEREPDGKEAFNVAVCFLLNDDENEGDIGTDGDKPFVADVAKALECLVCEEHEEKAEDEGISVVEPVGPLKTVPEQVDCGKVEACDEDNYENT